MKIILNKWIGILTGLILLVNLNSCIKDKGYALETDFSSLQDHVDIVGSGLTNFTSASIGFNNGDTTTVTLTITLASVNLPSAPVKVTIGVDAAQVASYNAANGTDYVIAPTDIYSIATTSLTIPAGQQYVQTTVSFYKDSVDPATSYMLPISITDASGKLLTGNLNTMYYHIIGNPLAGNYLQDFHRWNGTTDTTTAPNSSNYYGNPIVISPVSATSLLLPEDYIQTFVGSANGVTLSFSNNAGVLSNFSVFLDAATQSGLTTGGFKVMTAPVLVQATVVGDQSTHYAGSTFRIYTVLQNSTPAIRTLIDQFVKQF